jgi:endonuclease III
MSAGAREVSIEQLGADTAGMLRAHHLLRRHDQELCIRSVPECPRCPLVSLCPRIGVAR